jgi:hypothetical protein
LEIESVLSTTQITIESTDSPSGYAVGDSVDFIQSRSGNDIYSFDIVISSISPNPLGTIITFSSAFSSSVEAGDCLSPAGYSPYVNFVPNEAYSFLETSVCRRVLSSLGDYEISDRLQQEADEEEKRLKIMLEPRIDGEPTVILDRSSLARGNKFSQRRFLFSV